MKTCSTAQDLSLNRRFTFQMSAAHITDNTGGAQRPLSHSPELNPVKDFSMNNGSNQWSPSNLIFGGLLRRMPENLLIQVCTTSWWNCFQRCFNTWIINESIIIASGCNRTLEQGIKGVLVEDSFTMQVV